MQSFVNPFLHAPSSGISLFLQLCLYDNVFVQNMFALSSAEIFMLISNKKLMEEI